jgi:hypothetical protein
MFGPGRNKNFQNFAMGAGTPQNKERKLILQKKVFSFLHHWQKPSFEPLALQVVSER